MLRRWFCKRAIFFHLLVLILAPGCLYAGWWQVHRAMAGNILSYLYSVEWPVFAVISVIGWWQLIHEDPAEVQVRKEERRRRAMPAPYIINTANPEGISPAALRAASRALGVGSVDSEALADLLGRPGVAAGLTITSAPVGAESLGGPESLGERTGLEGAGVATARADGTPRDGLAAQTSADEEPVSEIDAYNAYLASLAVFGGAKTWRNPKGLPR